jgi:hypothetical protein
VSTESPKLATRSRQNLLIWGMATIVMGIAIVGIGYLMLTNSAAVATNLLGAKLVLGLPMTEADTLRIHAANFASSMVLAFGALAVAAGIVLALRGDGARPADRV